jgi:hypothetical protein
MLEFVDDESRIKILILIYNDYQASKKFTVPDLSIILDWENFRNTWLQEKIVKPLEALKNGK